MTETSIKAEVHGVQSDDAAAPSHDSRLSDQEDKEEEEETCGFCIFMKAGGCREAFMAWSDCVDRERESGGDFTEECRDKTFALRDCMLRHKDYYAPVLDEEDAAMKGEAAGEGAGAALGAAEDSGQHPDAVSQTESSK